MRARKARAEVKGGEANTTRQDCVLTAGPSHKAVNGVYIKAFEYIRDHNQPWFCPSHVIDLFRFSLQRLELISQVQKSRGACKIW